MRFKETCWIFHEHLFGSHRRYNKELFHLDLVLSWCGIWGQCSLLPPQGGAALEQISHKDEVRLWNRLNELIWALTELPEVKRSFYSQELFQLGKYLDEFDSFWYSFIHKYILSISCILDSLTSVAASI
jgi:hypothetical protein